jgi:WD40 repeat protein
MNQNTKAISKKIEGTKDACAIAAFFHDGAPIIVFGDGSVIWGNREFETHENGALGAIICPNSGNLILLGDNGKLRKLSAKGAIILLDTDFGFADCIIANQKRGLLAISASRKVYVTKTNGEIMFEFTPPLSPTSIAFDVAGDNLAVGHGKGVSLYDLKTDEPPIDLNANGGICALTFSPDLCFLVAATNEPGLIGWRLHDGVGFKMAGYPTKPLELKWFDNGRQLLTSGGPVGVAWPFIGPNGPMGTNADTFETRRQIVSAIAIGREKIALGYSDGGIDLIDIKSKDLRHIAGAPPSLNSEFNPRQGESHISALAISANSKTIAFGTENGKWGIIEV